MLVFVRGNEKKKTKFFFSFKQKKKKNLEKTFQWVKIDLWMTFYKLDIQKEKIGSSIEDYKIIINFRIILILDLLRRLKIKSQQKYVLLF